jgi:DNA-binding NtrC family response regulator
MQKPVILILEANEARGKDWRGLLLRHGYEVIASSTTTTTLQFVQNQNPDLILFGSTRKNTGNTLEIARQIRQWDKRVPLILIVEDSTEELAIAALKAGVNDYFKSPFAGDELVASIQRCLTNFLPSLPSASQEASAAALINGQRMIGKSGVIQAIKAYIHQVAVTDSTVLITGESGTGKELVAELIHKNSPRYQKPLVCVNCAAIPDSLLESELFGYERGAFTGAHVSKEGKLKRADGGTVFFDEIGEMSPYAQAKILRTMDSGELQRLGGTGNIPVDLRIIAATNQDLEQLMSKEKFRKDLYFRLNVAHIHLPPLRERKEDLPLLCDHYIREWNRRCRQQVENFTEEALEYLFRYDWPGNIRELKNVIEASFITLPSRQISFMDLPSLFRQRLQETETLPQNERDRVLSSLLSTNWNRSKAAQKLRWSRMTLYRKMAKYQIEREDRRENGVTKNAEKIVVTSSLTM